MGSQPGRSMSLIKGTVDVLVLKALSRSPMHGYEITKYLEQHSGGRLELDDSVLYHALYRLEEREYVEPEWGVTSNNRRARYYVITAAGRKFMREEVERLRSYTQAMMHILAEDEA